jgi:hypothetical protein
MIIGVAGTAKNTGKTTTLCTLIQTAYANGHLPGVTGIGYDGEERDNVTLLPKPRITVFPGMIVTTSEQCLAASTAKLRVLYRTGILTALGEVVVTVIEGGGLVVVAGPNKTADLAKVARHMVSLGVSELLVDGSLNRIAPMAVADRVVFATGGARSTNLALLTEETSAIEQIFQHGVSEADYTSVSGIRLIAKDMQIQCAASAFHGTEDIVRIMDRIPEGLTEIILPGIVTADALSVLCDRLENVDAKSVTVVFDNPFRLLLAGEPARVGSLLRWLGALSVRIRYRRRSDLAAITFNPYYPAFDGTTYRPAYLDASSGRSTLSAALTTPVIDVMADGGEELYKRCFDAAETLASP